MQARYGNKWVSSIDGIEEVAVNEWSEILGGLTGEQIKTGLESWNEDWPPSAPEFKNACLQKKKKNEYGLDYVPEYYRHRTLDKSRLLSSTEREASREKAKDKIREIKESIK